MSTTCSQHPEKDTAGPKLEGEIITSFPQSRVTFKKIVADDKRQIVNALTDVVNDVVNPCDVLFTVGGTGFAPSDVTPEATREVIEKEAVGLVHAIISKSLAVTDMAMLSRPVCGIRKKTIIVNFPGSAKAASECFHFVKNALPHAIALLREDDSKVRKTHEEVQSSPFEKSKVKIVAGSSRTRTSQYRMFEVDEAKETIFQTLQSSEDFETIPIFNAVTRILGEDIKAPMHIPPFPASIKDGYAVKAADGVGNRAVRSATAAGDRPETADLQPGEIIRISTGAPIPAGADAVVQIEDTALIEASENGEDEIIVEILVAPKVGQDIRKVGSDIHGGTVVLEKYTRISAATVGVLATLGFTEVKVIRRPTIAIVSTGNELCNADEPLKPGQIYDSNKLTLLLLLQRYGYKALDAGIAKDTPDSVKFILEKAFEHSDFIITSGGVSMGEYDLLKQVLIEDFNGTLHFGRLNMKPGKPTVFVTLDYKGKRKTVFALPGNPVSCCVTSLLFVIPALKHLEGDKLFKGWPNITVILEDDIINNDARPEYVRLTVWKGVNGQFLSRSTGNQISSRLNSMVNANALLLVPGKTKYNKASSRFALLFGDLF